MIIETSLWVDFTRKKTPPALKAMIHPWIMDTRAVICEPVAFEVLRHATTDEQPKITAQFSTLPLIRAHATLWKEAATLGQVCRGGGISAGSLDLIIAAMAIHHRMDLVTFDKDYAAIAKVCRLRVVLLERTI